MNVLFLYPSPHLAQWIDNIENEPKANSLKVIHSGTIYRNSNDEEVQNNWNIIRTYKYIR